MTVHGGADATSDRLVVVDDGTGAQLEAAFDTFASAADLTDNDGDMAISPGDEVWLRPKESGTFVFSAG